MSVNILICRFDVGNSSMRTHRHTGAHTHMCVGMSVCVCEPLCEWVGFCVGQIIDQLSINCLAARVAGLRTPRDPPHL